MRRVEDLVEPLVLLDSLAVALRPAQHQHVAALRQNALDPPAPVLAGLRERGVDEHVVVDARFAARGDAIGDGHHAGLVRAPQGREDRLACVGEDDERVDALRDHALDVGDRLLRVALPVGVVDRRHVRALLGLRARGRRRHETPAVASEAVREAELDLLRPAPRRDGVRLGGRRPGGDEHADADERSRD